MNPSSKVGTILKTYDAPEILLKTLHRLKLISTVHSFEIFFNDVTAVLSQLRNNTPLNSSLSCREILENELSHLAFAEGLHPITDIRRQFQNGIRWFAAIQNNTVVALNGVHTKEADLVYIRMPHLKLPRGVAYLNGTITAPEVRRQGIASILTQSILTTLNQEGYQSVFLVCFTHEKPAIRWHQKQGYLKWGRISYYSLNDKDHWWIRKTKKALNQTEISSLFQNHQLTTHRVVNKRNLSHVD